jgi:hypothetical protein
MGQGMENVGSLAFPMVSTLACRPGQQVRTPEAHVISLLVLSSVVIMVLNLHITLTSSAPVLLPGSPVQAITLAVQSPHKKFGAADSGRHIREGSASWVSAQTPMYHRSLVFICRI